MFNSKNLRNAVLVATAAVLATGGAWATETAKPKRRAAPGMMSAIPGESLVCVRINKFDATLDSLNAFLKDVAPPDVKRALLSKLTGLLGGDDQLRGVNKKGNIAIFVLNVPGESPARGPLGNMFVGVLLPIGKYESFVSSNANVGEPDEQGISTIAANGRPMALATNWRRFALLCPSNSREQLTKVKKMLNQRKNSLEAGLDPEAKQLAASSPVWVYVNVKEASQMIQPMLFGKLEQIKGELEKAKDKGEQMPVDPAGIINFYGGIFKMMLEGTENVSVALAPSGEGCTVTLGLKPVPDTTMAAMVGEPMSGSLANKLGYLDDGSMFNMCTKIDRKGLKIAYMGLFDLVGDMIPGGLSEADKEQLKGLITKGIDAMGDTLSISFKAGEGTPPFAGKYVIAVRDQEAFEQVLEEELKLMEEGVFADLYKSLGMKMDVEIDRDAGTYKGSRIGAATVAFKMGDEDSPPAQMMAKMFGDGLKYRWAFAGGNCVYTIGSDADKTIRELVDQVTAGGPKQTGSEIRAALAAIPGGEQADVIGTFNYVRMLNMAVGFMPLPGGPGGVELSVPTKSNIAFAASTTAEGNLKLQYMLPREHLLEIKSAFETLIPKIKEQERLQREKQKETARASNN